MSAHRKVIFWIAIAFVIVSSARSDHKRDGKAVCYQNSSVTVSANVSYTQMYENYIPGWWCRILNCWKTRSRTAYKTKNETIWRQKEMCCRGYEYKNGTCELQCPLTCKNGNCAKPNTCACNYGWSGKFCNESHYCSVRINSTEEMSEPPALKNVQNVSENFHSDWVLPECDPKCRDQITISNRTVGKTRSADFILYFLPIDSFCNVTITTTTDSISSKKYGISIGALIGIVLFAVAGYAVFVVQRKRKMKKKVTNQPPPVAFSDYMEENEIYS